MEEVLTKISQLDFDFLLYIFLKLIILAGIYRWAKSLPQRWQTIINLGIIVLIFRIILFQNPLAWYVYHHTLDPEVIGWRQSSVLYDEFAQYKKHEDVKYLAVGSSQTGAIYNSSESMLPNFQVKSLAGLNPVDMYLYRHNILKYQPEKILLYLSDFDMGRPPALETLKLAPVQGLRFPVVYYDLKKHFSGKGFGRTIKEMVVGEIFPEFKYSFIFKGYVDQLFGKNEVFPTVSASMSSKEYQEYQFKQLREIISENNIGTNLYFLNEFISFFEKQGITVLIIEGQYHPKAYTSKNLAVKRMVRDRFEDLERTYPNVQFIPESEIMSFTTSDFRDAYHVKQEAGKKFMQNIALHLNLLENQN